MKTVALSNNQELAGIFNAFFRKIVQNLQKDKNWKDMSRNSDISRPIINDKKRKKKITQAILKVKNEMSNKILSLFLNYVCQKQNKLKMKYENWMLKRSFPWEWYTSKHNQGKWNFISDFVHNNFSNSLLSLSFLSQSTNTNINLFTKKRKKKINRKAMLKTKVKLTFLRACLKYMNGVHTFKCTF